MNGVKRSGLLAFTLVLATSAWACSDSDPTGPDAIAGSYQLISVAGQALPVLVGEVDDDELGTVGFVLSDGLLTLSADESFVLALTAQLTLDEAPVQQNTETESGTYQLSGSTITFTSPQSGTVTGTIDGSEITVTETVEEAGTVALVFRK